MRAVLLALVLAAGGCGLKGNLYLPEEDAQADSETAADASLAGDEQTAEEEDKP